MRKKSILALLLTAMVLLSGCSLVIKDQTVDNNRVIIDVKGETIKKANILYAYQQSLYNAQLNAQMYQQYLGYAQDVDKDAILQQTLDQAVSYLVTKQKAAELGFDKYTDEELATLNETANTNFQSTLDSYKSNYFADSTLTGDELAAKVKEYAANNGYTLETALASAKNTMSMDKLKKSVTDTVELTDADLQTALDTKITDEKASYEKSLSSYGSSVNSGTAVYYAPAGYRYVKQILIKLAEADTTAISDAKTALTDAQSALDALKTQLDEANTALAAQDITEESKATYTAQIASLTEQITAAQASVDTLTADKAAKEDAAYAAILPKATEIAARAASGEDFSALAAEFNEDTGMPASGYAVCADFANFDTAFTTAAMALDKVGAVTAPVKGIYGYYIIQYSADIPEGPATLESARETLSDEVLKTKQDTAYTAAEAQWTLDANVKVYKDRLTD
jgi:parvulin-like peptidyl-prolyl isomerase